MSDLLEDAQDYNVNESLCILIQGPPGSGKTTLALQFPNPAIMVFDQNISGPTRWLRSNGHAAKFKYANILWKKNDKGEAVKVPEPQQYKRLTDCINAAVKDPWVQTIIIDPTTQWVDTLLAEVRRQNGRTRSDFRIQDWGDFLYLAKNFISFCRAQGKIVIFNAHERVEKDDVDGILKYFLAVPGQLADQFGGLVSDVWRCEVEESAGKYKFVVRTMPSTRYALKNSLGLPPKFEMKWEDVAKAIAKSAEDPYKAERDKPATDPDVKLSENK